MAKFDAAKAQDNLADLSGEISDRERNDKRQLEEVVEDHRGEERRGREPH